MLWPRQQGSSGVSSPCCVPRGEEIIVTKKSLLDFQVKGDGGASVLTVTVPPRKTKTKAAPSPLKSVTEWYPNVLAFDQSLSSTGWAWMFEGVPFATGMVTTAPLMEPGFEDSFQRGVLLAKGVREVIDRLDAIPHPPLLIAHEMPIKPNPSMKTRNREAGIVAAMAVRFAT